MLHLHRYKIIFSVLFSVVVFSAHGQKNGNILVKNLPNYDNKKMHYGFYLGAASTRFNVDYSKQYVDSLRFKDAKIANPKSTIGFNIGFVISRKLGDYFTVRFLPGVGFYTREIDFEVKGTEVTQEVNATTIQTPLLIKYAAKRRKNSRMYFVAGVSPSIDVGGSRVEERIDNRLRASKDNFSVEYGAGIDLFYPFFKFAPEIRVSHGFNNLLIADDNTFSRSFTAMRTNSVTLYLFFE